LTGFLTLIVALQAALAGIGLNQLGDPPSIAAQLFGVPCAGIIGIWAVTLLGAPAAQNVSTLRGTRIEVVLGESNAAVKRAVRQRATAFGGVVLKSEDEVSHFLAVGVPRTGKSLALRELIYTARARGDRVFVADPDGGAMKFFHTSGDIVLNPYDSRSEKWDIFLEIEGPADYANLAAALLPFSGSNDSAQWEKWAQDIFAVCLRNWHENQLGTTNEFTTMMATASNEQLAVLCHGQEASRVFKPGMEKMLGGILQTLSEVIKDLRLIADGTGQPFSVRQWVREGKGSFWGPYMAKQVPTLRRVVSWWTSIAIAEVMSLEESRTRRLWIIVDELDALGPITDLDRALVRGGKFGLCVALGFQTIAQVQGTYGKEVTAAIIEYCDNRLFLRCNMSLDNISTAQLAANAIGETEVERVETSNTQTEGQHGSSSNSVNKRRQVEKAVLPSEMTQLPKREGYLKIQSDPIWKRIRIAITDYPTVVPPFVPIKLVRKDMTDHMNSPKSVPQPPPIQAAPTTDPETSYPRMSFPFSEEQAFNLTAEFFGMKHPKRPAAPSLEGDYSSLRMEQEQYERGWIDGVWCDFRQWWVDAPEEERYQEVMAALNRAGLKLAGFDAIPEALWKKLKALKPAEGKTPFLGLRWAAQI